MTYEDKPAVKAKGTVRPSTRPIIASRTGRYFDYTVPAHLEPTIGDALTLPPTHLITVRRFRDTTPYHIYH
jgi:hypothetical protein